MNELLPKSYKPVVSDPALRGLPFEKQSQIVFSRLSESVPIHPLTNSNTKTPEQVAERLISITQFHPPSIENVDRHLAGMKGGEDAELGALVHQLAEQTSYFDLLKQTHLVETLEFGTSAAPVGSKTLFIHHGPMIDRLLRVYPYLYGYHPLTDLTVLPDEFPSSSEIWRQLATTGTLPKPINACNRERMVDEQYSKFQHALLLTPVAIRFLVDSFILNSQGFVAERVFNYTTLPFLGKATDYFKNDPYLSYIYALETCADSPVFDFFELDEQHEIIGSAMQLYEHQDCTQVLKAHSAFRLIRSLKLLGLPENELIDSIRFAGFNMAELTYPKLEKRLSLLRDRLGLTDDNQFRDLVNGLDFDRIIEIAELRIVAMKTAHQKLRETTSGSMVH